MNILKILLSVIAIIFLSIGGYFVFKTYFSQEVTMDLINKKMSEKGTVHYVENVSNTAMANSIKVEGDLDWNSKDFESLFGKSTNIIYIAGKGLYMKNDDGWFKWDNSVKEMKDNDLSAFLLFASYLNPEFSTLSAVDPKDGHYSYVFSSDKMTEWANKNIDKNIENKSSQSLIESIEAFKKLNINGEIWIDQNFLIQKAKIYFGTNNPGDSKVTMEIDFSDHGKRTKSIKAPENIINLNQEAINNRDTIRKNSIKYYSFVLTTYYSRYNKYPINESFGRLLESDGNFIKDLEKFNNEATNTDKIVIDSYKNAIKDKFSSDDPSYPNKYYSYRSDGKSYSLFAILENDKDPDCNYTENSCFFFVQNGEIIKGKTID